MPNKCKKCNYINIGKTNKYIFLILIEALACWVLDVINDQSRYYTDKKLYPFIYNIIISLGYSLSFILFIIYNIRNKRKNNKINKLLIRQNNKNEISWKTKFLWILLLSIVTFISTFLSCTFTNNLDNYLNLWPFYIIFLSLFSYWILRNKLYKHHYISIIIITIISLLYNIIVDKLNFEDFKQNYIFYILEIIYIILYSLESVLVKYYMLIKYIKSYEILFIEGLIVLILSIITLIIAIKIGYINNFWNYYENIDIKEIIIFVSMTLISFINGILMLIIIDIFSPFYNLLSDNIQDMIYFFYSLKEINLSTILSTIVFLIIYIFMVLIFIELIELNFLGLSKMTKKNIELRAQLESIESNEYDINDTNDSILEGYIIYDENGIELNNDQIAERKTVSNE